MTDDYMTQRRHRRIPTTVDVRISTIEPEQDPWTGRPFFRASHETCTNLSRGGAFVLTSEPLRPGRRLLLEIQLPGGEPIEAIGRIAWSKKIIAPGTREEQPGVGVEFLGGAADQLAALEAYIDENVTDADEPSDA